MAVTNNTPYCLAMREGLCPLTLQPCHLQGVCPSRLLAYSREGANRGRTSWLLGDYQCWLVSRYSQPVPLQVTSLLNLTSTTTYFPP